MRRLEGVDYGRKLTPEETAERRRDIEPFLTSPRFKKMSAIDQRKLRQEVEKLAKISPPSVTVDAFQEIEINPPVDEKAFDASEVPTLKIGDTPTGFSFKLPGDQWRNLEQDRGKPVVLLFIDGFNVAELPLLAAAMERNGAVLIPLTRREGSTLGTTVYQDYAGRIAAQLGLGSPSGYAVINEKGTLVAKERGVPSLPALESALKKTAAAP